MQVVPTSLFFFICLFIYLFILFLILKLKQYYDIWKDMKIFMIEMGDILNTAFPIQYYNIPGSW